MQIASGNGGCWALKGRGNVEEWLIASGVSKIYYPGRLDWRSVHLHRNEETTSSTKKSNLELEDAYVNIDKMISGLNKP